MKFKFKTKNINCGSKPRFVKITNTIGETFYLLKGKDIRHKLNQLCQIQY